MFYIDTLSRIENSTFLRYSAFKWTAHLRDSEMEPCGEILDCIFRVCNPSTDKGSSWLNVHRDKAYTLSRFRKPKIDTIPNSVFVASRFGLAGVLKKLLKANEFYIKATSASGNTALHFAVRSGRPAVVEMLLHSNSLNLNAQNKKGKTALSSTTDPDMISVLQSGKVGPNLCDFSGQTPLHDSAHGILSKRNSSTIYKLLLGLDGVSPDPEDESGRTPLFFAALFDKEIIVKMLLETRKVDPECEDCFGWTPLQCAQKKKKKDTRLLLTCCAST